MMKIVGIVILTISSVLLGFSCYKKYKIRPESLEMYINLLNKYLVELKWKRKSFVEVLKDCDGCDYIKTFRTLSVFHPLEDSAINKNIQFNDLFLNEKDKLIIKCFFKESGKGNLENEITLCNNTLEYLKKQKEDADLNFKKMGPLSIKLSVIIAIWIAIMFI